MSKTIKFKGYRITLDRELENRPYDLIWDKERTKFIKLVDFEAKSYKIEKIEKV
jgi:hypothetical protein